jgi:hypothetical protein
MSLISPGNVMPFHFTQRPLLRALLWFAAWMLFGFLLIESLHVAVDWWQGQLANPGWREMFWLLLLPVLLVIFVRYFSIFRPGCRACALPETQSEHKRPS